jgi:hypothetical protein
MFEGKAFHIEIIDKKIDPESTELRVPINLRKEAIFASGLIIATSGAIIVMHTISQLIINSADQF